MEKIKCWVVYSEEYPGGIVYQHKPDALEASLDKRDIGLKAYTRVKYFTSQELESFGEAD